MSIIRQLPEDTINKIKAGEVVERPASVVKELVENSIDAGAKNIVVKIKSGGKKSISVTDDGCGMDEADLYLSLERHATSKLSKVEDLSEIDTMGFRGEALPSIASVTNFSITSATSHGDGYRIVSRYGKLSETRNVSVPKGTEIVADDIFFNVPVRKKFLKSDEREYALIRENLMKFSVVYPQISFSFFSNDRNLFTLPAAASPVERISSVWKIQGSCIGSAEASDQSVKVRAFVPDPTVSIQSLSVVAVNRRIISDRLVNAAIMRTFKDAVGGEFRTSVVIFIDCEPAFVDVNVHPSKQEVRFRDTNLVANLVRTSIVSALADLRSSQAEPEKRSKPPVQPEKTVPEIKTKEVRVEKDDPLLKMKPSSDGLIHGKIDPKKITPIKTSVYEKKSAELESEKPDLPQQDHLAQREEVYAPKPLKNLPKPAEQTTFQPLFSMKIENYKKVGVLFGVYIILEVENGVIFLDQHAAHERMTYNRLRKIYSDSEKLSQLLISPVMIRISPSEKLVLEENLNKFTDLAFDISLLDDSTAVLRAIPAIGFDTDWEKLVKGMLGEISEYGHAAEFDDFLLSHIAQRACKTSVRRNDLLHDAEIDALVEMINRSDYLTCPHGRPFFFTMSRNEFEKRVQRK